MVHESLESALNESEQAITRRECWGGVGGGGGGGGLHKHTAHWRQLQTTDIISPTHPILYFQELTLLFTVTENLSTELEVEVSFTSPTPVLPEYWNSPL